MFQLLGMSHKSKCNQSQKKEKDAENYRPISLNKCIAKICETALKNNVFPHCENNDDFD